MNEPLTLYGAKGSGAVAVEAALTLIGRPYTLIDVFDWSGDPRDGEKVLAANPMRQVPALVLPDGEILTESAGWPSSIRTPGSPRRRDRPAAPGSCAGWPMSPRRSTRSIG